MNGLIDEVETRLSTLEEGVKSLKKDLNLRLLKEE